MGWWLWLAWLAAVATAVLMALAVVAIQRLRSPVLSGPRHVAVLVLGDVGRSPRMQYHALSLAKHGCQVSLIGYPGKPCLEAVQESDKITTRYIDPWMPPAGLPFSAKAVLKVISLCWQMLYILVWDIPSPRLILAQTPPAVPTLFMALVAAAVTRSALVVDHHNFGYTLLALKLGSKHPLVLLYAAVEKYCGRYALGGFCVTEAMKEFLAGWGVSAIALHDKPASIFKPTSLEKQHDLFSRLWEDRTLEVLEGWWPKGTDETLFTYRSGDAVRAASDRPRLVMSATSWTPDEDFGPVLRALPALDAILEAADQRMLLAVSGAGDLRSEFERKAKELAPSLKRIRTVTLWLSFTDYAALLGSADLGLSLHSSSSGIDLPMKVLDMFGAGLPVCARGFKALPELLRNGENGVVYNNDSDLAAALCRGLGLPSEQGSVPPPLTKPVRDHPLEGWDSNWDEIAWPYLSQWLPSDKKMD